MRICFVTTGDLESLATGKRATGMAQPLVELGHDVSIVIQDTPTNRERLALECPDATPVFFEAGSPIAESMRKRALLREARPNVVYVCAFGIRNLVVSPFRFRRPIQLVEHSELRSGISELSAVVRIRERALELAAAVLFDGHVCASRYLERVFRTTLGRARRTRPVLYSPYAYGEYILPPQDERINVLRARYQGRHVFVYMGTLTENYGLLEMIEASRLLLQSRRDFSLLLIGRGRHSQRAAELIAAHHLSRYVELVGYVPEAQLSAYFGIATAFLMPLMDSVQDWARCPSKLFMYLPYEKPIITCPVGEALEHLGEHGFYFAPGDTQQLADRMVQAITASGRWRPGLDYRAHSWRQRARAFSDWLTSTWGTGARGEGRRSSTRGNCDANREADGTQPEERGG